jgi:hypothetical protein
MRGQTGGILQAAVEALTPNGSNAAFSASALLGRRAVYRVKRKLTTLWSTVRITLFADNGGRSPEKLGKSKSNDRTR